MAGVLPSRVVLPLVVSFESGQPSSALLLAWSWLVPSHGLCPAWMTRRLCAPSSQQLASRDTALACALLSVAASSLRALESRWWCAWRALKSNVQSVAGSTERRRHAWVHDPCGAWTAMALLRLVVQLTLEVWRPSCGRLNSSMTTADRRSDPKQKESCVALAEVFRNWLL